MKKAIGYIIATILILLYGFAWVYAAFQPKNEEVEKKQMLDTSALSAWCGQPAGTVRMVGAWFYDVDTLEDETGNLWGYDGVEDQAFYLLWIDDMGTPAVEDDTIVKVWQEI